MYILPNLKFAIFEKKISQRKLAIISKVPESQLSNIVHCRADAKLGEKNSLKKALDYSGSLEKLFEVQKKC